MLIVKAMFTFDSRSTRRDSGLGRGDLGGGVFGSGFKLLAQRERQQTAIPQHLEAPSSQLFIFKGKPIIRLSLAEFGGQQAKAEITQKQKENEKFQTGFATG